MTMSISHLSPLRLVAALAILGSAVRPAGVEAQDDVEMLGRIYGTRPPAAYYDLRARNEGAFEFGRAWKARNPRLEGAGPRRDGVPRFEQRGGAVGAAAGEGSFEAGAPAALARREGVVEGTFRFPLVLGYFGGESAPPAFTAAEVQREFFDGPSSRYATIPEFYDRISGGKVTLVGHTYGWVQSGLSRLETTAGVSALGGRVGLFVHQLLEAVDDGSIDWGQYDNDGPDGVPNSGDDDGFVDVLAVFHPTYGAECGGSGQSDRVWAHKWTLTQAWYSIPEDERPGEATYATTTASASGGMIRVDDYTIQPVVSCDQSSINEIGVLAHELGHGFGLPDLYCTTSGCPSNGIGRWGLMGSGSWGCGSFNPARPCHMSAWSKSVLGWVDVETLAPDADHGVVSLEPVETAGRVVRIDALDGSDEYFLLENRQRLDFDQELPGTGLLVWHIDPDFIQAKWPTNSVNALSGHLGVWLRQADGRLDLEGGINRSDAGDPFPGIQGRTAFHAGVAPASVTHDGRAAGVTLTEIEEVGGTVRFRAVSGYRTVRVEVDGSQTPGLVLVDDAPLAAGGEAFRRAPFQGMVLSASAGESLGTGMRRPFVGWADDPTASRLRVFITPLDADSTLTATYGGAQVLITPDIRGGVLEVPPGSLVTSPPSADLWVSVGREVSIRAAEADGFAFVGWLGEWVGRPNPFAVTPLAPLTVGAEFGLTFSSLAIALARDRGALDVTLRDALDRFGNGNGGYDVGDLRAYLRRGDPLAAPAPVSARIPSAVGAAPGGGS